MVAVVGFVSRAFARFFVVIEAHLTLGQLPDGGARLTSLGKGVASYPIRISKNVWNAIVPQYISQHVFRAARD